MFHINRHSKAIFHVSQSIVPYILSAQFIFYPLGHWNDLQYIQSDTEFGNMCSTTMFQNHKEFFSKKEHLGVILNTDGVSMFKSSRVTIWPVYIQIANLLPALQVRVNNIITCGIWVGQKKPSMSVLLNQYWSIWID